MSITSMYRGKSRKGQWVKLPNVIEIEGITLLCGRSGGRCTQTPETQ